jgi:hypothetical protein
LIIAIYFTSLKCQILFGGKEIENHEIPDEYGAIQPTAVFVPLKEVRASFYFFYSCYLDILL